MRNEPALLIDLFPLRCGLPMGEEGLEPSCLAAADFRTTIDFATRASARIVVRTMPSPYTRKMVRREPSRLYTLPASPRLLALARRCHQPDLEGFADFDSIHAAVSLQRAQTI